LTNHNNHVKNIRLLLNLKKEPSMKTGNIKILLINSCPKTQYKLSEALLCESSTIRTYTNAELALEDWKAEKAHYDLVIFDWQLNVNHLIAINTIDWGTKIIFVTEAKKDFLGGKNIRTILKPTTSAKFICTLKEKIVEIMRRK